MLSFVFYLWILLTTSVAAICTFAVIQPYWFLHPDNVHSFGIINYCRISSLPVDARTTSGCICALYGGDFRLDNIPTGSWRATFLLMTTGCGFLVLSVCMGLFIVCIRGKWHRRLSILTSYIQVTAGELHSLFILYTSIGITIFSNLIL